MHHANVASRGYQASVLVPIRAARRAAIRVKPPAAVQHQRASPSPLAGQATERTARDVAANCNFVGGVETAVQTAPAALSVSIPTREARSTLRFQLIPSGKGQAVVVSAVAESSSAQQAGVERGMKLTAISDPIRRDEIWELQDRPSLRYIRDVMRMRNADFIEMCFVADQELLTALEAAEGAISMTGSSSSSSSTPSSSADSISSLASFSDSGETLAERLQQQYERAQAAANKQTAFEQRQQRRKDYMSQVGQRNDNTFVAIMASAFLVPALVILLVAYFTGYLDNLYSNSLTNLR